MLVEVQREMLFLRSRFLSLKVAAPLPLDPIIESGVGTSSTMALFRRAGPPISFPSVRSLYEYMFLDDAKRLVKSWAAHCPQDAITAYQEVKTIYLMCLLVSFRVILLTLLSL